MKRIVLLSMVLVMMLMSIGGCWVGFDVDDRGGRGGGHHDRGGGHDDRGRGHDRD
jgi:hypothetical protein